MMCRKSSNNWDCDGRVGRWWAGELSKEGNFLFSVVMGFLPTYSLAEGLLNQKDMSLI